tara:strand:+ start:141 stop:374 length:234 start_codon:yes stop_codon:yes gene_type:complete
MTVPSFFYVLYLITIPDVLSEGQNVHRIAFEEQEDCLYMAHTLDQELDPFARKQQCQELTEYNFFVRVPLPKPEGMS